MNKERPWEEVEKAVLKVYKESSPSFQDIENSKIFEDFYKKRTNLFKKLSIPPTFMRGKKVLDIGGGTGENLVIYANQGGLITIVEPNEISCKRAKELMEKNNFNIEIINQSLYDLDPKIINSFDIVICEGVLHHTFNPLKGLNIILNNLKKDALVVVSLAESAGYMKRELQREFVRNKGNNKKDEIIKIAKQYFQEHLDKAVKYGLRKEINIIFDTYINPQIKTSSLEDICDVFFKNRVEYHSSYPRLASFFETLSWRNYHENPFNYNYYKNYYKQLEKIWAVSGSKDEDENHADIDLSKFLNLVEKNYQELIDLKEKIKTNNCYDEDLKLLQKGYLGIGLHHFAGVKK